MFPPTTSFVCGSDCLSYGRPGARPHRILFSFEPTDFTVPGLPWRGSNGAVADLYFFLFFFLFFFFFLSSFANTKQRQPRVWLS